MNLTNDQQKESDYRQMVYTQENPFIRDSEEESYYD